MLLKKKQINQKNKTKQIVIKRMKTKFENKFKNLMTMNEIESKIQLEIIKI
jgi:hypothetical protein